VNCPARFLKIRHFSNAEMLAGAVADVVVSAAHQALDARDVFHLVLAGGSTPRRCYEILRHKEIDWTRLHVWFGDERCLPVGDRERNDVMANDALLQYVPIPASHVHRIAAELGPLAGAADYCRQLEKAPVMDLVLLGMGEDGHTASLFPDNPALNDIHDAVPVFDSPKPPPERVSMGMAYLNAARHRILMVAGEGKREAWQQVQAGVSLPVALLREPDWYSTLA